MQSDQSRFRLLMLCDAVDAARVREYRERLEDPRLEARVLVEGLPGGADLELEMQAAVRGAQLILVFLSRYSVARTGQFQKMILASLERALQKPPREILVIPVRLDDCETHLRLEHLQRIDIFHDTGWEKLAQQIRAHVDRYWSELKRPERTLSQVAARSMPHVEIKQDPPTVEVPLLTFPRDIKEFVSHCMRRPHWKRLDEETRRFITTLGCKIEPIIQIAPATGATPVVGFECLALGAMGESFAEICARCAGFDPGLLRLSLAVAATKSLTYMRVDAHKHGQEGARNLFFSINLDPLMVEHPHFETYLEWHRYEINHNVIFEINETTTRRTLRTLKMYQVEYGLRYAADDLNSWDPEVRASLMDRVEMTKLDYNAYNNAMKVACDDPHETIFQLKQHKIADKPLVLEGIEKKHLRFLQRWWKFEEMGSLYGQGQSIEAGPPWEEVVFPLKPYGGAGGGFIRPRQEADDTDGEDDD